MRHCALRSDSHVVSRLVASADSLSPRGSIMRCRCHPVLYIALISSCSRAAPAQCALSLDLVDSISVLDQVRLIELAVVGGKINGEGTELCKLHLDFTNRLKLQNVPASLTIV